MLEDEYQLNFFHENGFVRKQCPKCESFFWTRDTDRTTCGDAPCDPYTFIGNPVFEKPYELNEMREQFLKFFEKRDHTRVNRYPVTAVWREDIHLTIASIANFQPFVTSGQVPPPANPLTISQPCVRLSDLDAVGRSGRHLTLFEMMAHHAFNTTDNEVYWKEETVALCDEFLNSLGVDPLAVTYKEEPWAGGGNAGPCLETLVGGLEVATLVFMNLKQSKDGDIIIDGEYYEKMNNYIVDTGYGLERLVWASKGTPTIYDAIFPSIVNELMEYAGLEHELEDSEYSELLSQNARFAGLMDVSEKANLKELRKQVAESIGTSIEKLTSIMEPVEKVYAIADHTRCLTFMLGDGVVPSNVKAGYLARLVFRRTTRMMRELGMDISISDIIRMHIDKLQEYPEFEDRFDLIEDIIQHEEDKFEETLNRGIKMIQKMAKQYKKQNEKIPLDKLIEMYDSHGIPPEIAEDVASDMGVEVELPDNFYSIVAERHSMAKEKEKPSFPFEERISKLPQTKLLFYNEPNRMEFEAVVLDVFDNYIVLDRTLFYPEGGGQPADKGVIIADDETAKVVDVKNIKSVVLHEIDSAGNEISLRKGDLVTCKIDGERRASHAKHHTATHIVNDAAKKVLGTHIWQAGAQKFEDRARLDLSHYKRIKRDEIKRIELIANETVMENKRVVTEWVNRNNAEKRYGLNVYQGGVPPGKKLRILKVGDDIEACGGTHCSYTGYVGPIKILKSERIQDGVERLEFSAGEAAVKSMQDIEDTLQESSDALSVLPGHLPNTIERFFEEWKQFKKENEKLKEELADIRVHQMMQDAITHENNHIIAQKVPDSDSKELQKMAGELVKNNSTIALLISNYNGVKIAASASKDAVDKGINVGNVVKEISSIVSGGGGGRPDMAQGGGTDTSRIDEALNTGLEIIKEQL
ncbi:alanine--tRNA ligase [Methanohalobium sp.]|uniref:alanine--tRNA ligase n=1 Tax=Methanohalobium sp. TaxID=2837493 RepID=UPI0025EFD34A|nr:alanine--tRNA ligase [Methanohalobium sp.]